MISIIIPVYDSEKFLTACLNSVMAQNYINFEAILINDGSSDNSRDICLQYCNKDSRFKLLDQENKGASAARNLGIENANGDYITFVDSDDILPAYFLEKALEIIKCFEADIVIGGYRCNIDGNECLPKIDGPKLYQDGEILLLKKFFIAFATEENNTEFQSCPSILSPWGKLFKRNIISNVRFDENLVLDEDTIFNLYSFDNANRIVMVPNTFYIWIDNPKSISRNPIRRNIFKEQELSLKAYRKYIDAHPNEDFEKEFFVRVLWSYNKCLSSYLSSLPYQDAKKEILKLFEMELYKSAFSASFLSEFNLSKSIQIYRILGKRKMAFCTYLYSKMVELKRKLKILI